MANVEVFRQRAKASNDRPLKNGFTGAVRQRGDSSFENGEVFVIPEGYAADTYEVKLPNGTAQYTLVQVCDSKGKPTEETKRLFPSVFTRGRYVYEEVDGKAESTGEMVTNGGAVADVINSKGLLNDAIKALVGKPILVTQVDTVQTVQYGTKNLVTSPVYNFDFLQ